MVKKLVYGLIAISLIGLIFLFVNKRSAGQTNMAEAQAILFWGIGCPHCVNVDNYIKDSKVDERFKMEKLEVSQNRANASLLREKALVCKLPTANLGVPFLFDKETNQCLTGDTAIIEFLKTK